MQALFKTRVELGGVDYACGTHEVPQAHAAGWYFDALIKDGLIVPDENQEVVAVAIEADDLVDNATGDSPKRRGRPHKAHAE